MRPKRLILLFVLFMGLAGGALAFKRGWFSGEPIPHWRSVSSWTKDVIYQPWGWGAINDKPRPGISEQPALSVLISCGRPAVPVLFDILTDIPVLYGTNFIRQKIRWLQWQTGDFALISVEPNAQQSIQQTKAGIVLMLIGKKDGGGILPLLEAYEKAPMSYYGEKNFSPWLCIREAIAISPGRASEYKDDLVKELGNTNHLVRALVAGSLGLFPGFVEEVLPKIISLEKDQNVDIRLSAYNSHAYLVTNLRTNDSQLLSSLENMLTDTSLEEKERAGAARAIELMGAGAAHSLPILQSLVTETNKYIRVSASLAIRIIEKAIKEEREKEADSIKIPSSSGP